MKFLCLPVAVVIKGMMFVGGLTQCLPHSRHSLNGSEVEDDEYSNKSNINTNNDNNNN